MFSIDDKSTKESGWCLTPENNKLTIVFGQNTISYEGQEYKDLLAQLSTIRVVNDRHTHWVNLLGKALKEVLPSEKEEESYELSEIAPYLVKYCTALQGKECVAVEGKSKTGDPTADILEEVVEKVSGKGLGVSQAATDKSNVVCSLSWLFSRIMVTTGPLTRKVFIPSNGPNATRKAPVRAG
jgi:hypothetical protein